MKINHFHKTMNPEMKSQGDRLRVYIIFTLETNAVQLLIGATKIFIKNREGELF